MKAVVLAAGNGIRLGQLVATVPKPLLHVGGRPVVDYVLDRLADVGVTQVFMNAHHHADVLVDHCGDGRRWGIEISYVVEHELTGSAGAVKNFSADLGDSAFFVVYGDNYFECDFGTLWRVHSEHDSLATIALFERDDVTGTGIVDIDQRGRVRRFAEKPPPSEVFSRLINGGLYVLSPGILEPIPDRHPCDFGYDVFPRLVADGHEVYGHVMAGAVWGIDTPQLYEALCLRMAHGTA